MPSTSPAPDQPAELTESAAPLAERIRDNADRLTAPAAQAQECQDTASLLGGLLGGPLSGPLGGLLSDRTLKRNILAVDWSR